MTSSPRSRRPQPRTRSRRRSSPVRFKPVLAGSLMFAFVGLLADGRSLRWPQATAESVSYDACETIVAAEARLSRSQLAQLLTVPERNAQSQVRQIVKEPYCTMPDVEIRSGVVARREAYPLEFQPETKLVILYENEEYAGYRFSFE